MPIYERDISVKRRGRGSLRGTSYEEFGHIIGFPGSLHAQICDLVAVEYGATYGL